MQPPRGEEEDGVSASGEEARETFGYSDLSGSDADRPEALCSARRRASACAFCDAPGARFRCGQCRSVRYCDRRCQRRHWARSHALDCSSRRASGGAIWAEPDVFAQVLAGLTVRAACRVMEVCLAWRRCGPYLLEVARFRGHPGARRLRSRPHGVAGWRRLHVAEKCLLSEDFKEGGNRWQRIGDHSPSVRNGDARVEENSLSGGRLSARGTESFGAPLVAAAFVHRLARPCRPRSLRIRFRCMPRTFGGRCSAYIALAESDTCLDQRRLDFLVSGGTTSGEGESVGSLRPAVALVFYTWSLDGASRGRGRRVVGLLGDDAGQRVRPIVDDAAASDSTDLEVRFVWGREMQLTGEATSKAEDSEALEDHDGPRLSTYDGGRIGQFAHVSRRRWKGREGLAAATAELRVGAFGRVVATSAPTAMVRCIILGVGPGSAAEIEEILLM
eukprot:TRINITY_DN29154_c0_g1_i2.p1 TRINITY_DN29154_c0_g1~~TRINITY_DN29154_c0_g1_i2.p1  ORF type:complete len:446 (+),score=65.46 TRINITY_DN29154_c0_g1_i2:128-1465(+)